MIQHLKLLLFLGLLLLAANSFLPSPDGREFAGGLEGVSAPKTVTYQLGDGKGSASETDDGTIGGRYLEDALVKPSEYHGSGDSAQLDLKRFKETVGVETTIDTRRFLLKFPNIIGDGPSQIPTSAAINSGALKLTLASITGPENMRVNVYRVLERWEETESGYLRAPSWRQYQRSVIEGENRWANDGADVPASSDSIPVAAEVLLPRGTESVLTIDVTSAVTAWAGGKANNGLMLRFFEETIGTTLRTATFYASESSMAELRPKLEVVYTPKPPPPPPPLPPCPQLSQPVCSQGFATGPTAIYDTKERCIVGYDFKCKDAPPAPAPAPVPTPPSPLPVLPPPAPKPAPVPEPKPAPALKPAPAPTHLPARTPLPPPPTPTPSKPAEESKPVFITRFFQAAQKSILGTWAKIIELFR